MNLIPKYIPIIKAKQGEMIGYDSLSESEKSLTLPIFEIPTESWEKKKIQRIDYVDNKLKQFYQKLNWQKAGVIAFDCSFWNNKIQILENQEHIFSYTYNKLINKGYSIAPIIGYDRWHNELDTSYQTNLKAIDFEKAPFFIIRLDGEALEHIHEGDFFIDQLNEILFGLKVNVDRCILLLDRNNIANQNSSKIISDFSKEIEIIESLNPLRIAIASHSMPKSIRKLVPDYDSSNLIFRLEENIWRNVREKTKNPNIIYSDYGIIANDGEESTGGNNNTNNGKIRYTTQGHLYVLRGHPYGNDGGKHTQMFDLARNLIASKYFENISWGDQKMINHSLGDKPGSDTNWISYELNHHFTYMVQEVIAPIVKYFQQT